MEMISRGLQFSANPLRFFNDLPSQTARRMTPEQFNARGESLSAQAGVLDSLHGYFRAHARRLHRCCERFDLFSRPLGEVLEIGPFYGYTPFFLRSQASSYTVMEGDDPAVYALRPLYERQGIALSLVDFFEVFGPARGASHRLVAADSSFDTILCWETMEHFNFNPVKFVRELRRVLKPGGRVCITVPNRTSFQNLFALLTGRGEGHSIGSCFQFEDYESNGKKAFYGFHWREYTPSELRRLFTDAGFKVEACGTFTDFQGHETPGLGRRLARLCATVGTRLLPRFGKNVYLVAVK